MINDIGNTIKVIAVVGTGNRHGNTETCINKDFDFVTHRCHFYGNFKISGNQAILKVTCKLHLKWKKVDMSSCFLQNLGVRLSQWSDWLGYIYIYIYIYIYNYISLCVCVCACVEWGVKKVQAKFSINHQLVQETRYIFHTLFLIIH